LFVFSANKNTVPDQTESSTGWVFYAHGFVDFKKFVGEE
jgi:hypothetical protein